MLKMIGSLPGFDNVGNFRGDHSRYDTVLPGQVIHGHDIYSPELKETLDKNGIGVILMIRDPRDQLVSRVFHIKRSENHIWHERMQEVGIDDALMMCIEGREKLPPTTQLIGLTQSWLCAPDPVCVIRYEDLLQDTVTYFMQALEYIGLGHNRRLAEVIVERNRFARLSVGKKIWQLPRKPGQEDPHSHFRKGIAGDWRNYFKPDHNQRFKELAGQQLIDLGYEKDLDW
jgi:hypothetical protein